MGWRKVSFKHLNCLNLLLHVSWRDLTRSFRLFCARSRPTMSIGTSIKLGSPMYPESASTLSPLFSFWSFGFNPARKTSISCHEPALKGPLIQTIQPVWIAIPTSYFTPCDLNLGDLHAPSYGLKTWTLKSVPSILHLQMEPLSFTKRFSHLIYIKINKKKGE